MSRIKGAAIRARLQFLAGRVGEETLCRALDGLDPMDQVVLTGTLLPSIWYPFQVLANLDEAVRREVGAGADRLFEEAGEAVAAQHARSIYKVFFRETDPRRILKLATCIFSDYYSGAGRLTVEPGAGPGSLRLVVADGAASPSHCLTTVTYFRAVLEACTGRSARTRETQCRCRGDAACEVEVTWGEPPARAASA